MCCAFSIEAPFPARPGLALQGQQTVDAVYDASAVVAVVFSKLCTCIIVGMVYLPHCYGRLVLLCCMNVMQHELNVACKTRRAKRVLELHYSNAWGEGIQVGDGWQCIWVCVESKMKTLKCNEISFFSSIFPILENCFRFNNPKI